MLVYDNSKNRFVIDPHYLGIIPFKKVYESDPDPKKIIAEAKMMWIYHMYNPHSPFRDIRNKEKNNTIVQATFPKWFLDQEEKNLKLLIEEAELKNKDSDAVDDTVVVEGEIKPKKKKQEVYVPKFKIYDPLDDELISAAAEWYKSHLQKTPLWASYEAYKEAMYNLSSIISDENSSAQNIRAASQELDTIPKKMENMKQQAIKDEANTLKVTGEKNIKRGEKLVSESTKFKMDEATKNIHDE